MVLEHGLFALGEAIEIRSDAADPVSDAADFDTEQAERYAPPASSAPAEDFGPASPFQMVVDSFRAQSANQVRIEQQMTIRISPRPQPVRPNMLMDLPGRALSSRVTERKIGKCLKASGIAGVQADGSNRLLLFTSDWAVRWAQDHNDELRLSEFGNLEF